jgi:hypothetical protein
MKVICRYNTGEVLSSIRIKPLSITDETQYGELEIGAEYFVMGIAWVDGCTFYLVDSGRVISLCPYALFEITNHEIVPNWFFNVGAPTSQWECVCGYSELCFHEDHYIGLVEMNQQDHELYFRRKAEAQKLLGPLGAAKV